MQPEVRGCVRASEGTLQRLSLPVSLPEQNLSPCLCTPDKCMLPRRDCTRDSSKGQAPFRGTKVRAQGIKKLPSRAHPSQPVTARFRRGGTDLPNSTRKLQAPEKLSSSEESHHVAAAPPALLWARGPRRELAAISVSGAAKGPAQTEAGECSLQFPPSWDTLGVLGLVGKNFNL